jgi:hypothetical protein
MKHVLRMLLQARTQGNVVARRPNRYASAQPRSLETDEAQPSADSPAEHDVEKPEPETLKAEQIQLDVRPPRNVAILHVQPDEFPPNQRALFIRGFSQLERPLLTERRSPPKFILADLAQDLNASASRSPSQILAIMRDWSMTSRDICDWINRLRAKFRELEEEFYLVVQDHTGLELPWELLRLPSVDQEEGTYLGVAVSVSRWQSIIDNNTYQDIEIVYDEIEHTGQVLGFVDRKRLTNGGLECEVLGRMGARLEDRLLELKERMTESRVGFGLIYIACHGHYASDPLRMTLGTEEEQGDQLVLGLLRDARLHLLEESNPIVFLNACHSGRMFREAKYLYDARLRGFPEMFLGHGAKGVIATTGFINDTFAAKTAQWLLPQLWSDDPKPISTLLREWRRRVAQQLPPNPTEHDKVALLNAYMYVYYGNPLARVRLTAPT